MEEFLQDEWLIATAPPRVKHDTDEILRDFPYLEDEDIAEALRYAAEAVREQELPLRTAG